MLFRRQHSRIPLQTRFHSLIRGVPLHRWFQVTHCCPSEQPTVKTPQRSGHRPRRTRLQI